MIKYQGPDPRGLILLVLCFIAGLICLIHRPGMTWQLWTLMGIMVVSFFQFVIAFFTLDKAESDQETEQSKND